jgi:hypothetical protein
MIRATRPILIGFLAVLLVASAAGPVAAQSTTTAPDSGGQGLFAVFDNPLAFIGMVVLAMTAMGMASKSMAVAIWGGYLTFAYLALETGMQNLVNVVYATIVIIFVGTGFKIWRLEGGGEV